MSARRHYAARLEGDWAETKRELLESYGHRAAVRGLGLPSQQQAGEQAKLLQVRAVACVSLHRLTASPY